MTDQFASTVTPGFGTMTPGLAGLTATGTPGLAGLTATMTPGLAGLTATATPGLAGLTATMTARPPQVFRVVVPSLAGPVAMDVVK